MIAVIMAGGLGTRIASISNGIPKPMVRINDKPVLQYQIENLRSNGIRDIILVVGHLGSVIKNYFCDGSSFGVNITYFTEDVPHGTAGALFFLSNLKEDFLLILGDILFDVDLNKFISFHYHNNALASVIAHPNAHNFDSSLLRTKINCCRSRNQCFKDTGIVTAWLSSEDQRNCERNLANCGIHIITPELLGLARRNFVPLKNDNPKFVDLDRNILKPFVSTGRIFAYQTTEYLKDMGTPQRYAECEIDIKMGMVKGRSFSRIRKAVIVFLDQLDFPKNDDVIISYLEKKTEAIRHINNSQYLLIFVTNLSGCTDVNLRKILLDQHKLDSVLASYGVFIDVKYNSFLDISDVNSYFDDIVHNLNLEKEGCYFVVSSGQKMFVPHFISEDRVFCPDKDGDFLFFVKHYIK